MTYYDAIADGYDELHEEEQNKKIALIKAVFHPKKTDRLLDVGCGTGITTEPWPCRRYGVDPSKKLLDRARQKDKIEYKWAAAEDIPYPDAFFDHVISITAVQNFSSIKKGLEEMRRVGKDSFIITYLKKSEHASRIKKLILRYFKVKHELEEDKDVIFICNAKE